VHIVIGFEGLDGAGKSTQIKLIKEMLEKQDIKVKTYQEPGPFIKQIINREHYEPVELLLLYTAERMKIKREIDKTQETVILCDRTFLSSYAYQVCGMDVEPKVYSDMLKLGHPKYDKIFVFQSSRIKNEDAMDNRVLQIREKIQQGYTEISRSVMNVILVDTDQQSESQTADYVCNRILELVKC
jgi:thymidylate kinase